MTTMKKENNDMVRENSQLKSKLNDLYFLNQKLDEALRNANERIKQLDNSQGTTQLYGLPGGNNGVGESTNVGDSTFNNNG